MSADAVGVGVHAGRASARAAVAAPAWVWIAIGVGVAALAWSCTRAQADDQPDWLDPNAPPISAPTDYSTTLLGQIATVPGQALGGTRAGRKYPWGALMTHPCCWVGDC